MPALGGADAAALRERAELLAQIVARPGGRPSDADTYAYFPLEALRDLKRWTERLPPDGGDGGVSPHFRHGDDVIWGLTGRFIRDLVSQIGAGTD